MDICGKHLLFYKICIFTYHHFLIFSFIILIICFIMYDKNVKGAVFFAVKDRISIYDMIGETIPTRGHFIFKSPPLTYVTDIFQLPFSRTVWFTCCAFLITFFITFFIITKYEKDFDLLYDQTGIAVPEKPLEDSIQIQISTVCQQGLEVEPRSTSGRIATFVLLICMMFLYNSYSANILTLLQSRSKSLQTLQDLLESRIELGAEDNPFNRYFFKHDPGDVRRALYNTKIAPAGKPENFLNYTLGVSKIRKEFYAFHSESSTIYKEISYTFDEHEKCGLQEISFLSTGVPYFVISKNTPYGELYKVCIRKLLERGITNAVYKRIYYGKPKCTKQGGLFSSISLLDLYTPFMFYIFGHSLAAILFTCEILFKYKRVLIKRIQAIKSTTF